MARVTRLRLLLAFLVLAALPATPGAWGAAYPATPFDFAHPAAPHTPLLSPASGNDSRPLLVILAVYSDYQETITTAQARDRFFASSFGSVGDYYRTQSFNRFGLTPATESEGTANDGVIRAPMGKVGDIQTAGNDLGGPFGRQAVLAANATDNWINFKSFDENSDGKVDERELLIVVLTDFDGQSNCGGTRTITDTAVDGVNLTARQYSFDFGLENNITTAHELAHQAFGTQDQFYIAGPYDITSITCQPGQPYFSFNSWHKLHLGWTQPQVVTRDGYYDVPNWTSSGTSFLLYDPDKGTDDYFLVENRQRGGYDANLAGTGLTADNGLIIWQVNDKAFGQSAFTLVRPIGAQTSNNYGGSRFDAWDPSDPQTPQRTMQQAWSDGTASTVAVRAIGPRANTMRAYFDVRGAGILVDPSTAVTDVTMLQANPVSFPVMNTGEASDSFTFTLTDLPAGWSVTPQTQTLAAGAPGTASVQLTVPGDTPTGDYTLQAKGTSTSDGSVTSSAPLSVRVIKRATTLVYNGATSADYSDPAAVSAVLTDTVTGQPIAGKTVDFALGTQSTNPDPVTDATGTAADSITITQASGPVLLSSTFAGDGTYLASSDSDAFTISKETLSFTYTGSSLLPLGTTPTLSSTATEEADGSAGDLSLAEAIFSLTPTLTPNPFSYTTAVGPTGASTIPAVGLPADVWSVTVAVPATNPYWEGSTSSPSELVLFDPAAKFTGDAAGRDKLGAPISVLFDARYDTRQRPRGSVKVRFSGGTFTGKDPSWIVQVGSVTIFQTMGTLNGTPATLRLRADDNAEPPHRDTFRVWIGPYDSGTTTVTSGNLQSHPA